MEIQWLGHSAFRIEAEDKTVLVDPFLTGNPMFPPEVESTIDKVDYIVLTHGHEDHLGDTVRLAQKHKPRVIAIPEVCAWLTTQGVENCVAMNIGGTVTFNGLAFSMVNAVHSSSVTVDGLPAYMGTATGFVVKSGESAVYHAGDTDIFSDMALIQKIHSPNVGLIPIGGHYTMSPETAAMACNEFLDLEIVVPMHYGTFPVLAENADEFERLVTRGKVEVLEPAGTLRI